MKYLFQSTKNITKSSVIRKFYSHSDVWLLISFVLIGLIGILNHEMWRDELEAWLIAKHSYSLSELLTNTEYIGHPILWYFCLYFLQKITSSLLAMQLFHLAIATAYIAVFLYYSPFTRLQKTLFCFGYFPLYEYGIISRSYGMGVLFLFIFCALFPHRDRGYLLIALTLALLSHTNVFALIIGMVLAAMLVLNRWIDRKQDNHFSIKQWNIVTSVFIYLFGLITAIVQIVPPQEAEYKGELFSTSLETSETAKGLFLYLKPLGKIFAETDKAMSNIWKSYAPIPNFTIDRLWENNLLTDAYLTVGDINLVDYLVLGLSLLMLFVFIVIFSRKIQILLVYVVGNLFIFVCTTTYPISIRHSGYLFILLIICWWLSAFVSDNYQLNLIKESTFDYFYQRRKLYFKIILYLNLVSSTIMYGFDIAKPFSASKDVANYIQSNQLENLIIVGSTDRLTAPLSALLDRPIYYPASQQFDTFTVWTKNKSRRDEDLTSENVLAQTKSLIDEQNKKVLLVSSQKLTNSIPNLRIIPLTSFEHSIVEEERYYIYLAKKRNITQ